MDIFRLTWFLQLSSKYWQHGKLLKSILLAKVYNYVCKPTYKHLLYLNAFVLLFLGMMKTL